MTRHFLWLDLNQGMIAFEYKKDGEHHHYEYLAIYIEGKTTRSWPKLGSNDCVREFHENIII